MRLIDARIGKSVKYYPYRNCKDSEIEYGVITYVNSVYVFVRYGNDVNSKATEAEDLTYDC